MTSTSSASVSSQPRLTSTDAGETVGNIDVSNLGPVARAYAARLTPGLTNSMTPEQFRETIRITPDLIATSDPSVLAELTFVRASTLNSAGLTPEVLARAREAGQRFDEYVLENYWIPGFEADSGIGATPLSDDVSQFRNFATRYDVLASLGPEYAPVMVFALDSIEVSPDAPLQAAVSMTLQEQQPQIPDDLAMTYRVRPSVAAPVNLSVTDIYSFSLTTVDEKKVWDVERIEG